MRYAAYDLTTGQILQWGVGDAPPGAAYIEHEYEGELSSFYVSNGALAPKIEMALTLPAGSTPADGISEAVVSGIPPGTIADFAIADQRYSVVIDDGSLDLVVHDPGIVSIRLWHPIYQHAPVEVTFV